MNLSINYKKILMVLGFIAFTILIGFLLYKVFFQNPTAILPGITPVENNGGGLPLSNDGSGQIVDNTNGGIPSSENINGEGGNNGQPNNNGQPDPFKPSSFASGGLTDTKAIVSSSSLDPNISADGSIHYYDQRDGFFYRVDDKGNISKMSDRVFYQVRDVTWAPNNQKAVLEYPDGSKILYNFETGKQISYPKHWEDFSFSPQSDQVIAKSIALDPDNRFLVASSDDGSGARNIEEIGLNADKVQVQWSPNNQIVATYTKGLDFDRQEVFFVGLNGENFKSTVVEGRGLTYQWSKTGDRLLYSVYNTRSDMKPKLWIVDAQGDSINENRHSLEVNTWADKCAFATNTEIYCAVPVKLDQGAGIFREIADKEKDEIYKIDLETGSTKLIAIPDGNYNIENVMVTNQQDKLTFSDKNSGAIYQINLK